MDYVKLEGINPHPHGQAVTIVFSNDRVMAVIF